MAHLVVRRFLGLLAAGLLLSITASAVPIFERPVPEDGGPTVIRCVIAVLDVDEINDAGQNFTVNVYSLFKWHDPREAHGSSGKIIKSLSEVWHPHLLFANKQRTWAGMGDDVEISPEGDVVYRQQFWGDFSQPMNLHDFPFDRQTFGIQVVAAGPEEYGALDLLPEPDNPSLIVDTYSVADWKIVDSGVNLEPYSLPTGDLVGSFTFYFTANRISTHHLIKIIAPLLMIVLLSWVVFWLDPGEGGSQLGVAVTSFLTVIAYHVALNSRLPEISYLTRLDAFVFGTTLLVFLAMIEVVVTTGMARKKRVSGARWLDRVCRVIFPGLLCLLVFYAFVWH